MKKSIIYITLGVALTIITTTVLCIVFGTKKKRCSDDCGVDGCGCAGGKKSDRGTKAENGAGNEKETESEYEAGNETEIEMVSCEKKSKKCCKEKV